MSDIELFREISKKFGMISEKLVNKNGCCGIQLKVLGVCDNGIDEYSFMSLHHDTEDECVSDILDWLFTRSKSKDSPEKRCDAVCMATSRPELELKLGLAKP